MNLPENFSVFDERNRRELVVLRAENALLAWRINPGVEHQSNRDLVRSAFNGHPITRAKILTELNLRHPFLKLTSKEVNDAVGDLLRKNELQAVDNKKWGRAFMRVTALIPVLALSLLSGCTLPVKPEPAMIMPPLPEYFTTPGRAPLSFEKRTPTGSRRVRAVISPTPVKLALSWTPSPDPRVTGYQLQSSTNLSYWEWCWQSDEGTNGNQIFGNTRFVSNVVANLPQKFFRVRGVYHDEAGVELYTDWSTP